MNGMNQSDFQFLRWLASPHTSCFPVEVTERAERMLEELRAGTERAEIAERELAQLHEGIKALAEDQR